MNTPKVQTEDPPTEGTSPDHNPDGTMPHGIPEAMKGEKATAKPTSARHETEMAPLIIEKS